ncbi:MAG: hypothetical protein FJ161_04785 [Gammaproteobacteria bacterium]|nr:hypothetical protein [Gammaproteobacteria bacterium]
MVLIQLVILSSLAAIAVVSGLERYWTIYSKETKTTVHLVGSMHTSPDSTALLLPKTTEEYTQASLKQLLFVWAVSEQAGINGFTKYYTEVGSMCQSFKEDTTRTFGTEMLFCRALRMPDSGVESVFSQVMIVQHAITPDMMNDWFAEGKVRSLTVQESLFFSNYPYLAQKMLGWKQMIKPLPWIPSFISAVLSRTLWSASDAGRSLYAYSARFAWGVIFSNQFNQIWTMNYQKNIGSRVQEMQTVQKEQAAHLAEYMFEKNICPDTMVLKDGKEQSKSRENVAKQMEALIVGRDLYMADNIVDLLQKEAINKKSGWMDNLLGSLNQFFKKTSPYAVYENGMSPVKNLRSAISSQVVHGVDRVLMRNTGLRLDQSPAHLAHPNKEQCLASNENNNVLVVVGASHIEGVLNAMRASAYAGSLIFTAHNATHLIEQQYNKIKFVK